MSLLLACVVASCGQPAIDASTNTIATSGTANVAAGVPTPAPVAGDAATLKLAGAADAASIAATRAEAKRQGMSGVEVTAGQSFRITEGGREIATVLTGAGKMPDATFAGCFVALRTGDNVELIPTLGYGDYEAQTCGGPTAVGILSSGDPVRFGMTFRSYSQDAEETVPMVVTWNRSDGSLLIDSGLSSKAADIGVKTVAGMRPLVR